MSELPVAVTTATSDTSVDPIESGTTGEWTPDIEDVLVRMKAYFLPVTIISGLLLSICTVIIANCKPASDHRKSRVVTTVSGICNILLIIFRPLINYWIGAGLFFSTGGTVYAFLDLSSDSACKGYRGFGYFTDHITIVIAAFEMFESILMVFERDHLFSKVLAATVVYFLLTVPITVLCIVKAISIAPAGTCGLYPQSIEAAIIAAVTGLLTLGLPSLVMLVCSFVQIFTLHWSAHSSDVAASARQHGNAAIVRSIAYAILFIPASVCICCYSVQLQLQVNRSEEPSLVSGMTQFFLVSTSILPTVDFLVLLIFVKSF